MQSALSTVTEEEGKAWSADRFEAGTGGTAFSRSATEREQGDRRVRGLQSREGLQWSVQEESENRDAGSLGTLFFLPTQRPWHRHRREQSRKLTLPLPGLRHCQKWKAAYAEDAARD